MHFQCKFFNSGFSFEQIFVLLYEIEFWRGCGVGVGSRFFNFDGVGVGVVFFSFAGVGAGRWKFFFRCAGIGVGVGVVTVFCDSDSALG